MSTAADDRLDAVTQDLHRALEARFGDLLGTVRAAETLARQVAAMDDEIRRVASRRDRASSSGDADTAKACEAELDDLGALRSQHVDDLAALTGRLHG